MTDALYLMACNLVDTLDLRTEVFESRDILEVASQNKWAGVSKAIYIILDTQAQVSYVGSVNGVGEARLSERMREHSRITGRSNWDRVMIVPLVDDVSQKDVFKYEGLIAALLKPYDSKKSPIVF
jgi:plasmid rolling circle replication initiator protein Rep